MISRIYMSLICAMLVACVDTSLPNALTSPDDEAEIIVARIDQRSFIPLGGSAKVSEAATLSYSAFTGPTFCENEFCFTNPTTANTTLTNLGSSESIDLPLGRFILSSSFSVAYLGSPTADTNMQPTGGIFRIVEEVSQKQPFGKTFRLSVTAPAVLPNNSVVRLTGFDDNRCPCLAMCVWEGLATVHVSLFSNNALVGEALFDDHVGTSSEYGGNITTVGGLRFTTKSVKLPKCEGSIDYGFIDLQVD